MTSCTPNCQRTLVNSNFATGKQSLDSSWLQHGVCVMPNIFHPFIADHHKTVFYKLRGHIPWINIAKNPSHYLSKQSRPDSDHKLQVPSHMKSDAVDAWCQHWLKLQKRGRRPLVLKDPLDKASEAGPKARRLSKRKAKGGKARYVESDDSGDQHMADRSDESGTDADKSETTNRHTDQRTEETANALALPPSPVSASATWKSRRTFLASLSSDMNYKKLQLLLYAAKVSKEALEPTF